MHQSGVKTAYRKLLSVLLTALLLFSAAGFSGCSLFTGGEGVNTGIYTTEEPDASAKPDETVSYPSDEYAFPAIDMSVWGENTAVMPVYYCDAEFTSGDIAVFVPVFIGMNSARLNAALRTAFMDFARSVSPADIGGEEETPEPSETEEPADDDEPEATAAPAEQNGYRLDHEITFSGSGLISVWMILRSMPADGEETEDTEIERRTFNYDVYFGKQISLRDAFGATYTRSAAVSLAGLVEDSALQSGYVLLGRLDPIPDDQMFVFSERFDGSVHEYGISFYFREYEIALPSQGCPQVFVGIGVLRRFSASNSSIRRLSAARPAMVN